MLALWYQDLRAKEVHFEQPQMMWQNKPVVEEQPPEGIQRQISRRLVSQKVAEDIFLQDSRCAI